MSNDLKVVKALLDVHLAIRLKQEKWGPNFKFDTATGETHDKLEAIKKAVQAAPTADIQNTAPNFKVWFAYIHKLAEFEASEHALKAQKRTMPFHLHLTAPFTKEESMLERAMHAARAYIAAEMIANNKTLFDAEKAYHLGLRDRKQNELNVALKVKDANPQSIKDLTAARDEHAKKFDTLVNSESAKYHEIFFKDTITRDKRNDQEGKDGKPLKEDTFADFCVNARTDARKPDSLNKLMAAPVVATPAVTATVTAAPAAATPAPATPAPAAKATASVSTAGIYSNSIPNTKIDEIVEKESKKPTYEYPTRSKVYGSSNNY